MHAFSDSRQTVLPVCLFVLGHVYINQTLTLQVPCQLAVVGVVKTDQPDHVQLMSSEI
jgi:hypothetical protein